MEKALCVAKVLYDLYLEQTEKYMDEMKMHKLMYFAQRESLMENKEKLFEDDFYGWKYGPVLKCVRTEYMKCPPFRNVNGTVTFKTKELLKNVLKRYGNLSSWKLSNLSHGEYSWKKARTGLDPDDNGDVKLELNAMMLDATREKSYRKTMK